jgi:hypothetical protein
MRLLDMLFRGYRTNKAKDSTIPKSTYKDGRYKTSIHCVEQMQNRKISKGQLHENLHTKPILTEREIDDLGRPAKIRYSQNNTRAVVNPQKRVVASVRKYRGKELKKAMNRRHSK